MASERLQSAQDLLDLTFQSLAMQHMDLKQVELDTAVAKVDELSRQLESLWSDGPGPPPRVGSVGMGIGDDSVLKRRPQKAWNESDLDLVYEKKPHSGGGFDRPSPSLGLMLSPWRESSLDGAGGGKDPYVGHSSTLPRNFKLPPGERRGPEGPFPSPPSRSSLPDPLLPDPQFPDAAAPLFLDPGLPDTAEPLRLREPQLPDTAEPPRLRLPQLPDAVAPRFLDQGLPDAAEPPRPRDRQLPDAAAPVLRDPQLPDTAEPPRLRDSVLPEAVAPVLREQQLPDTEPPRPRLPQLPDAAAPRLRDPVLPDAVAPVLPTPQLPDAADPPRPLSPTRLQPLLPPEAQRDPGFRALARSLAELPRPLKRRGSRELSVAPPPPRARQYRELIARLLHRAPPPHDVTVTTPTPAATPTALEPDPARRQSPPPEPPPDGPAPVPGLRSALRDPGSPRKRPGARVRMNPLVLLLDAALTGELDVVQRAVAELNDPSQPNDEGITALHNAICGAHYGIVEFLIASGADVNSPDSHGWTPLHCAASCNDTSICVALVRHGAAIFATTASDGSLAVEKCDPYREGYSDCYNYLTEVEQGMGVLNSGVVYALWDYSAALGDELSFREGEPVTVLRRQRPGDVDWWWGSLYGHEGFVPRNYFGLFPRLRPQRRKL
ncbi:relA-associated inhibitor [Melopsittacus undulatus]|uniref:relA-associated inhibitor n=1 Tax=Melopsittacus undulatus TaxID=13146 RepID=UPI00146B1806|nr:relA-associated inhibitor [Melopsittacus undulatus]